jgi:hypothetical protein
MDDREALYPAIGNHQLFRGQQFGEDAVFRGRVRCRSQADYRVRRKHGDVLGQSRQMRGKKHR